jgi:hypothetical protein
MRCKPLALTDFAAPIALSDQIADTIYTTTGCLSPQNVEKVVNRVAGRIVLGKVRLTIIVSTEMTKHVRAREEDSRIGGSD